MITFYITLTFLPLMGFIIISLAGEVAATLSPRVLRIVSFIPFSLMLITTIGSYIGLFHSGFLGVKINYKLISWVSCGTFQADWGFLFDSLTFTMFVVINTISLLVHLYSMEYMKHDPNFLKFMSYLSFFTFFMLMLVSANNFLQLFFGWEGVGLCSYLLISFWFTRVQANKAAIKAVLMNRIGDIGLALGISSIFINFGTIDYHVVFLMVPYFVDATFVFFGNNFFVLDTICCLLFVGSMGKSAQLGLHTWLPDAMEGPTPVSALIHAATMVTAGVFLIIRCSPLFEYAPFALNVVTFIGAFTCFFAASVGLVQHDLKKVIAYSTCSQLGYMVFACGLSSYNLSLYHLVNHAFFKALLFLGAGAIIHSMGDEQDIRKMGSLQKLLPFTYASMVIGTLALTGFPFFAGFYSKDVILEVAYAKFSVSGHFAFWFGSMAAFFTSFYSFRLLYLTFLGRSSNMFKSTFKHIHEAPFKMSFPLVVLSIFSVFIGYLGNDVFTGLGSHFFSDSIFILPQNMHLVNAHYIPFGIKILPTVFSLSGAVLAVILNEFWSRGLTDLKLLNLKFFYFLNSKWYFDKLYNFFFGKKIFNFAYNTIVKVVDKGFLELLGPLAIVNTISNSSYFFIRSLGSGDISFYIRVFLYYILILTLICCQL